MKDAATIVAEIDDILRDLWVHFEDPDSLSHDILKLAVLNGGLGNWLAVAQDEERRHDANYKHELHKRKLDIMSTEKDDKGKSASATYAESKAAVELADIYEAKLDVEHQAAVLKLKRQDTDSAIDAARSRLSLIKQDIKQGHQ